MRTGRNFNEILRCIDSLAVTMDYQVLCCGPSAFHRNLVLTVGICGCDPGRYAGQLGEGRGRGHSSFRWRGPGEGAVPEGLCRRQTLLAHHA